MKERKMDGAWAYIAERRGAYTIYVGKPEANKLLDRTGRSWEDKIRLFRKWDCEMRPDG